MSFSLIIPTKDRTEILKETLSRVDAATDAGILEVIIVNDSDQELVLPAYSFKCRIVRNTGSGVASARNFGAAQATHDWLIFMDDDMWVQPETFRKLAPFAADTGRCTNVNWVYPEGLMKRLDELPFLRYLHHYGFDSLEGWYNSPDWRSDQPFLSQGITSQFLLIHKAALQKAGGYNSSFPFAGFEDHDMSIRLRKAGIQIWIDPCNMIFHNEADRLDIAPWLERKKRGGLTRRVAVHLGHSSVVLLYPALKKLFYQCMYFCHKPVLALLKNWPSGSGADRLYRLLVNIMLGTYSCIGYTGTAAQRFLAGMQAQ